MAEHHTKQGAKHETTRGASHAKGQHGSHAAGAQEHSNMVKDPADWTTGDEPMTGAQQSYLTTLSEEAHVTPPSDDLTKAEASRKIDELQEKTGRGTGERRG